MRDLRIPGAPAGRFAPPPSATYGVAMYVGIAKLTIVVAHSTSLKEKRMVVRRVKDRVREQVGVAVNEVGSLDDRQRAELGVAATSHDRAKVFEVLDQVIRVAQAASDGQVTGIAKDAWTFDPPEVAVVVDRDRGGTGDKAAGMGDFVPEAWKEE
jgi:uncharacterized protein YlxP (DUF503 family)